jgi:hypothetical protein
MSASFTIEEFVTRPAVLLGPRKHSTAPFRRDLPTDARAVPPKAEHDFNRALGHVPERYLTASISRMLAPNHSPMPQRVACTLPTQLRSSLDSDRLGPAP